MQTVIGGYAFANNDLGKIGDLLSNGALGVGNALKLQSFDVQVAGGQYAVDISALKTKRILSAILIDNTGAQITSGDMPVACTDVNANPVVADSLFLTTVLSPNASGSTGAFVVFTNYRPNVDGVEYILLNLNSITNAVKVVIVYTD